VFGVAVYIFANVVYMHTEFKIFEKMSKILLCSNFKNYDHVRAVVTCIVQEGTGSTRTGKQEGLFGWFKK
jgi:hypothetical protein